MWLTFQLWNNVSYAKWHCSNTINYNGTFLQMMIDFPKCNNPLLCPWVLPNFCSKQNLALDHFFEIFLPLSIVLKIEHGSILYACKLYAIKCQIKPCRTSTPNSQTQTSFLNTSIPMNSGKTLECHVTVNALSINYHFLAHIPFFLNLQERYLSGLSTAIQK